MKCLNFDDSYNSNLQQDVVSMDCRRTDGNTLLWESQRSISDTYPRLPPTWRVKFGPVSSMMWTCLLNALYNVCQCCRKLGEINIPKRVRFGAIIKRNVWKRLKPAFVAFPESHLGAHHPEVCRRRRSWRPGTRSSCHRTGRSLQPEGSQ